MRIGIDASLASLRGTGTGRYAAHLLSRLIELDRGNEYVLYLRRRDVGDNPLLDVHAPHVRVRMTDAPSTLARLHVNLPIRLRRDRVELYHSLGFFLPALWFGKAIVTIHDIHPVLFPRHWNHPGNRISYLALRAHIPFAVRRAARILVPSEYTRGTIIRRFGIPPERITVTPYAADPFFFAPAARAETETMQRRFGSGDFFLHVGALSPLKNVSGLVEAFARFRQRPGRAPVRLILIGAPTGDFVERSLRPQIRRLGLTDAVMLASHVDEPTLRALYRRAIALVFPSFAEGFGFPALEAMASETAVVISRIGALCEVAGEAALGVDPHDPGALAGAMERLVTEPELRRTLIARGRVRAASFSWERTARQTLEAYEQVAAGGA
jgi:glycosyltransferase involved in cell wall biosynthesis